MKPGFGENSERKFFSYYKLFSSSLWRFFIISLSPTFCCCQFDVGVAVNVGVAVDVGVTVDVGVDVGFNIAVDVGVVVDVDATVDVGVGVFQRKKLQTNNLMNPDLIFF